jgi:hypothetical protein
VTHLTNLVLCTVIIGVCAAVSVAALLLAGGVIFSLTSFLLIYLTFRMLSLTLEEWEFQREAKKYQLEA